MQRYSGNSLAGNDVNIAVGVSERIVWRRQVTGKLVCRVDQAIAGISEPLGRLILQACLDTLAPRAGNILEKTPPGDQAGEVYDVVGAAGAKQAELPVEPSIKARQLAPHPRLGAPRDHLLQRRVGHQEVFQQTWLRAIGTGELERRRRPVCFRIAEI